MTSKTTYLLEAELALILRDLNHEYFLPAFHAGEYDSFRLTSSDGRDEFIAVPLIQLGKDFEAWKVTYNPKVITIEQSTLH